MGARLVTDAGDSVELDSLWRERNVVLALVRHFG